jgi:MarR family transcriptional regulator, organic hydroperoxide resistance regulator
MIENDETSTELRTALRDLRIELSINTAKVASVAGLNDSDLGVLDILARAGTQSPGELARRTGIPAATMTGVLARLQGTGWILRRQNAADGRRAQIESAGFARLAALYDEGNRRLDAIDAGLTAGQAAIVLAYLRAVATAIRAATGALDAAEARAR